MFRARKKPVIVETFRFGIDPQPSWFKSQKRTGGAVVHVDFVSGGNRNIWAEIHTLEGVMRAECGDWIIQGVNGEIYPCKPDIFEKTYDIVEVWTS